MPNGAVQSPQVLHGIPKDNAVSGVPDVAKAIWGKARQTMHVNIVDIKSIIFSLIFYTLISNKTKLNNNPI